SRGGSAFMWRVRPGAHFTLSTPRKHFELSPRPEEDLFFARGLWVTPIYHQTPPVGPGGAKFRQPDDFRPRPDLAFADELQHMMGDRLRLFVSEEGNRIDLEQEIEQLGPTSEFYVCGPIGMLGAAKRHWRQSGRPIDQLRFETFGSSGRFASQSF